MLVFDKNTPVLFLVFNRPDATRRVFSQIRKAAPKKLYIAADGPRYPQEKSDCEEVIKIVSGIDWDCDVFTLFRTENLGCGIAISQAVSWFFKNETEGIVLEDDCLPSDSFFGFCSAMLNKYRNDTRIGHISGGNYQRGLSRGDGSYYFSFLTNVWGWAGWRRVWENFDFNLKTFPTFDNLQYIENMPSHSPFKNYWNDKFWERHHNESNSWGFQYSYLNLVNNRLSIIPNVNLISNIGCFDKATHYIKNHPFADIPLGELDQIVHPSFVVADIAADIHSQSLELNISPSNINGDGFFFMQKKLLSIVSGKDDCMIIPKIIHQIYFDMSGPPVYLKEISQTWQEKHPEWEYRFWNKDAVEQFLESDFPEFISLYNSFPFDVQRWDFVRYLILERLGGLYVDMDYECIEPVDSLLWNCSCCFGMEPDGHALRLNKPFIIGNAMMACVPGHEFLSRIIKDISSSGLQEHNHKGIQIIETTGPYMVNRVYNAYERKDDVTLLPAELVAPLTLEENQKLISGVETPEMEKKVEKAFAIHYFLGSWTEQTEPDRTGKPTIEISNSIQDKKVLAIIVTFNGAEWIQDCLRSVFASSFKPDVLVVDNLSTDATCAIVEGFSDVILIKNKKNFGFGRANNMGLKYSLEHNYDFVFLINQDTIVRPDMFEKMVQAHIQHPDYGILSPLHMTGKGDRLDYQFSQYIEFGGPEYMDVLRHKQQLKSVYPIYFVNAAFWLLSRECIEKVGGFDPIFFHKGEDNDYINRVRFKGLKIGICPDVSGLHFRENRTESKTYDSYYSMFRKDILITLKNPFLKLTPTFFSIFQKKFRDRLHISNKANFLKFFMYCNLIAFTILIYRRVKRSRKIEKYPLSHLKIRK